MVERGGFKWTLPERRIDLVGQRFGRLMVLEFAGKYSGKEAVWLCVCDCGAKRTVRSTALRQGIVVSCGCYRNESHTTHGMNGTKVYGVWAAMKQRCRNPKSRAWANYGGRGIKVCDRWLKFENFLADMGEAPPGLSLDRIDNDGNYEPGNCRWATWEEQLANRRPSKPRSVN